MKIIENNLNDDNGSRPSLLSPSMHDVGCQLSSSTTLPLVIKEAKKLLYLTLILPNCCGLPSP
jgi:hypothetical protein